MTGPRLGEAAPDFVLVDQHGRRTTLRDFGGAPLLLVFVPFAFSDTCTNELIDLRDESPLVEGSDVAVAVVSCDSLYTMKAWGDAHAYSAPLLSDFWPHGEAARAYGVFSDDKGLAGRGSFLIDSEGILRWSVVSDLGQARDLDEYRAAIGDVS
ncbi:peroxiredoxin [Demequina globuliformis]|uniref:peroxiredoxin n=1 Tax=Demequina globuliformis TaxID=676202 RepID=UPI000781F3CC|nr:peroxiredoxin [Demequina globuliformis]